MKKIVNHESRAHALLSSSSSNRWLNCTPSARLEDEVKTKDISSSFAEEGTLAHELAEIHLNVKLTNITAYVHRKELTKIKEHIGGYYGSEMEEEVDKFVSYVIETYNEELRKNRDAIILIEEKVDLREFVAEGFGTCDVIIISDGIMYVIDLKYGKGVRVSAVDNPQLKLYGLGAIEKYGLAYNIENVNLIIMQPRLDNVSEFIIEATELIDWGYSEAKPKAHLAFEGKGQQKAGEWCRFCKVKATCRALADESLKVARKEFENIEQVEEEITKLSTGKLSDKELVSYYNKMSLFKMWSDAISKHMLATAIEGKKWPELKLVEGRSNRRWLDESEIARRLKEAKYAADQYTSTKLNGITAIQKLLGKKEFDIQLGDKVIKPKGSPTLVSIEDKRPAINSLTKAIEDFEEIK